ncbi:MAG TPA: SDR family oxidoreductase [Polyangiaceae bacterium]|nr:SDR family oxidoreductase [Polyangiaceae bacterium]
MPYRDYTGKAVLVTGGTMGIGLSTGLAFARRGAHVYITHKWGTADDDQVLEQFRREKLPAPEIIRADVASNDDTAALLREIHSRHDSIEAFVSNVAVALVIRGLDDYKEQSLFKSIDYSAWPMVEYTRRIHDEFGRWPRYVVGVSSGGPDAFYKNYDFAAASKSVLETLCRYLSYRLFDEGVRVNVVRSRLVATENLWATFGREFEPFCERFNMRRQFVTCEDVANSIYALCSGMLDAMNGQVVMVDKGTSFFDNLMRLYEERDIIDRKQGEHSS